ncbi:MAG: hypothetical protein ABI670_00720 [Chloroflexota bacterium]
MEERERGGRLSPEIFVYATNKNFLNVYDALRIEKIKIEIAGYDPNTNRQTGHASAWLDVNEARLLSHLIVHRLFAPVTGGKWEKFGGSQREDGSIESRTFTIEWDEGDGGRYARFPFRITLANGPGRKTQTGGISPAGEPVARLSMRMPEADMIKVMLAVGAYMQAYETAHHHRIVADRLRDLNAKLAERSGGPAVGREEQMQPASAPERARPAANAAPTAVRPPAQARPVLKAIPGGNSDVNRMDKARTARAG